MSETPYNIRCVRMWPEEIVDGWNLMFHVLRQSGLYDDLGIYRLLMDCIGMENMDLWLLRGDGPDGAFPAGCLITAIYEEHYTRKKWLLLMHVNDVCHIENEQWQQVYEVITNFSRKNGCQWIEVYTEVPRAQQLLTMLGFQTAAYRKAV
jgi:hypothetical protein